MADQKIVTSTTDSDGNASVKSHPNIREAADHVSKKVGKALPGDGRNKIGKALEGTPLTGPVTVKHEKGAATFSPETDK
jgi:hypothetical protein